MADVARRSSIWVCHVDAHDNDDPLASNDGDRPPPPQWATSAHNSQMAMSAHHNSSNSVELVYLLPPIPTLTHRTQLPRCRLINNTSDGVHHHRTAQHDDGRPTRRNGTRSLDNDNMTTTQKWEDNDGATMPNTTTTRWQCRTITTHNDNNTTTMLDDNDMTTTCSEEVEVRRTTAGEDGGSGMAPITGRGEVLRWY